MDSQEEGAQALNMESIIVDNWAQNATVLWKSAALVAGGEGLWWSGQGAWQVCAPLPGSPGWTPTPFCPGLRVPLAAHCALSWLGAAQSAILSGDAGGLFVHTLR